MLLFLNMFRDLIKPFLNEFFHIFEYILQIVGGKKFLFKIVDNSFLGVNLKARVADLEIDYHIEKSAYDVIICFNYLQRSLITQIKDGLRVGGIVVYETFTVDEAEFGKPKNPDYLLKYNELLALFRDFRCLYYREGIVKEKKSLARIIAKKVHTT